MQEHLQVNEPSEVLVKLAEKLDPERQNLNEWEMGMWLILGVMENVDCDGLADSLRELRQDKLVQLHKILGAIGAEELQRWLGKAVAVVAPELSESQYHQFVMPVDLSEQQKIQLAKVEKELVKKSSNLQKLACEFMRKNEQLFGWRYADRSNRKTCS